MQCMEIRGGNQAIDQAFEAPGIDVYVASDPFEGSSVGGGDIYYLTSCASGRITRILLADISGHGASAAELAIGLRDLLRNHVNTINQNKFVQEMNRQFEEISGDSGFATAAVATFFEPRRTLSISLAGHPYPLVYRSSSMSWQSVAATQEKDAQGIGNLPLGIGGASDYSTIDIKLEPGDVFLIYSDALPESVDANGQQLGIDGVLELLSQVDMTNIENVIPTLRTTLAGYSSSNLKEDDATMILGQVSKTSIRWFDNIMAPFRLLKKAQDRTNLKTA